MATNTNDGHSPSNDPTFSPALVRDLLLQQSDGEQTKRMTNEAALAAGELLRTFVLEARDRAGIEAECENEGNSSVLVTSEKSIIRADHISKIAAELLMDFS